MPHWRRTEIGQSGTCQWSFGSLDRNTTIAFYFDVVQPQAHSGGGSGKQAFLQFQTYYHHSSGRKRLRVTTVAQRFADPQLTNVAAGFDQKAAAVLMTRYAMFKMEGTDPLDVLRWLDRMLIRLVSKFASYNKDDVSSFNLSSEFTLFPQFMFNLRRSHFLTTFNISPDETAFYRSCIPEQFCLLVLC